MKVGDVVTRNMCGIKMPLTITEIKEDKIVCSLWEFDLKTGLEIDEDLGWGPAHGGSGSFIELN